MIRREREFLHRLSIVEICKMEMRQSRHQPSNEIQLRLQAHVSNPRLPRTVLSTLYAYAPNPAKVRQWLHMGG